MKTKNLSDKTELEELDIEAGLLSSADAVRGFLINKFDEVLTE